MNGMGRNRTRRWLWLVVVVAAAVSVLLLTSFDIGGCRAPARRDSAPLPAGEELGAGSQRDPGLEGRPSRSAPELIFLDGGVHSAFSGLPVRGALVTLNPDRPSATTDARGTFKLALPEGWRTVDVAVSRAGFLPAAIRIERVGDRIPAPVHIKLRPDVHLRIKVVDRSGTGVAGARVYGWQQQRNLSTPLSVFKATTDPDGRLDVLWPAGAGGAPAIDMLVDALTLNNDWASAVVPRPSTDTHILRVSPARATVEIRQGEWPTAPPTWADIQVIWTPPKIPGPIPHLPGRPVGTVRLTQGAPSPATLRLPGGHVVASSVRFDVPHWTAIPQAAQVADNARVVLRVTPRRSSPEPPRDRFEITVEVVDEQGRPIRGAHVDVLGGANQDPRDPRPTDAAGRVTYVTGFPVGESVHVHVEHPEYATVLHPVGRVEADDKPKHLRVVLARGPLRKDVVRLRITGDGGRDLPLAEAWWGDESGRLVSDARSLRPTRFLDATHVLGPITKELEDLLADLEVTDLVLSAPGHGLCSFNLNELLQHVGKASAVPLELPPSPSVDVHVEGADSQPAQGARVFAPAAYTGAAVQPVRAGERLTDAEGNARIQIRGMKGKETWILVLHPDGAIAVRWKAGTAVINAKLAALRGLRGRVIAPDGTPVAGARVSVLPMVLGRPYQDAFARIATTDEKGAFEVRGLTPGLPMTVQSGMKLGPREWAKATVTVPPDERRPVEVRLAR